MADRYDDVADPWWVLAPERIAHVVGIGGAGMSVVARLLHDRGVTVSGSDAVSSAATDALIAQGIEVAIGHDGGHLGGADYVVVSTAIRDDNPEFAAARLRGIPVLHRAQVLAALMASSDAVAVAGTHGKTTTSSMVVAALLGAGMDPSFAIGGSIIMPDGGTRSAHTGTDALFVAEADESDGSFRQYRPQVAVVTNLEPDHLDFYGTAAALTAAFDEFVDNIVPGGTLIVCADDEGSCALGTRHANSVRVISYGRSTQADVRIVEEMGDNTSHALTVAGAVPSTRIELTVLGEHNALNAVAAFVAGTSVLGTEARTRVQLAAGLTNFGGTRRRFEYKGDVGGIRVIDDYAHHPTELIATMSTARQFAGEARIVVAFQPHLYSRTREFAAEFAQALSLADAVVVTDVYPAREDPIPGITGAVIADAVKAPIVEYVPSLAAVPQVLERLVLPGDVVLTVGAGTITSVGSDFLALLASVSDTIADHTDA